MTHRKVKYVIHLLIITSISYACEFESENNKNIDNNPIDSTQTIITHKKIEQKDRFNWLIGKWKRVINTKNMITYEEWYRKNETQLYGLGYSLKDSDTVFYENMKLYLDGIHWTLEIKTKGDSTHTNFKLLEFSKNELIAENKKNEFPKRIVYSIHENKLKAIISSGDKQIKFEFEKLNQHPDNQKYNQ